MTRVSRALAGPSHDCSVIQRKYQQLLQHQAGRFFISPPTPIPSSPTPTQKPPLPPPDYHLHLWYSSDRCGVLNCSRMCPSLYLTFTLANRNYGNVIWRWVRVDCQPTSHNQHVQFRYFIIKFVNHPFRQKIGFDLGGINNLTALLKAVNCSVSIYNILSWLHHI